MKYRVSVIQSNVPFYIHEFDDYNLIAMPEIMIRRYEGAAYILVAKFKNGNEKVFIGDLDTSDKEKPFYPYYSITKEEE